MATSAGVGFQSQLLGTRGGSGVMACNLVYALSPSPPHSEPTTHRVGVYPLQGVHAKQLVQLALSCARGHTHCHLDACTRWRDTKCVLCETQRPRETMERQNNPPLSTKRIESSVTLACTAQKTRGKITMHSTGTRSHDPLTCARAMGTGSSNCSCRERRGHGGR